MVKRNVCLLITCEHAHHVVPARFAAVAKLAGPALQTHRGYDPGALELARQFAKSHRAPIFTGRYSRLLVELNRSLHHPRLWSEFSAGLSEPDKAEVLAACYHPYRNAVESHIRNATQSGAAILHVSVHSFTPVLDGQSRRADIGLLYDPKRPRERAVCADWKSRLAADPNGRGYRVRRNYPYLGVADGFVTHLRKKFSDAEYAGIELEINQSFPQGPAQRWSDLRAALVRTLPGHLHHCIAPGAAHAA